MEDVEDEVVGCAPQARRYRVYLWRSASAMEAEIVVPVEAVDAEYAIVLAMEQYSLTWVAAAWVVPVDDEDECEVVDYYSEDIWLLSFEAFQSFMRHCLDSGGASGKG